VAQQPSLPNDITIEVAKQQFEVLTQWSRFYHESEIKVNSGLTIISAIAAIGEKFTDGRFALGIVIIVASMAAFISTLGYWRYYEQCDMISKYYRRLYVSKEVRAWIEQQIEKDFPRKHPILNWIPDDAHHYVLLCLQIAFFFIGVYFTLHSK
jgi:hypothetical protein